MPRGGGAVGVGTCLVYRLLEPTETLTTSLSTVDRSTAFLASAIPYGGCKHGGGECRQEFEISSAWFVSLWRTSLMMC